jgi:hypothetical protein
MPVVVLLHVICDNVLIRQLKAQLSAENTVRLVQEDDQVVSELVYFVNGTLSNFNWDYVQLIGSDGSPLKRIGNPQRLREGYGHPRLKARLLTYFRPAI